MLSISTHRAPSRKQLRSFGFVLAGGFLVIGSWPVLLRHQDPRKWAIAIGLISGLAGLFVPTLRHRLYQVWMLLGECLGWVN